MRALKDTYNFLRWRLIPVRQLGGIALQMTEGRPDRSPYRAANDPEVATTGYRSGPKMPEALLAEMREIYMPLAEQVQPTERGHPFKNLFRAEHLHAQNPVMRFAFSPEVLGAADEYFGGRLTLDSLQVLWSFPTTDLRESQMWHRDYGDSKSFHSITYLNDVRTDADGPFVFVDRAATRRIKSLPIIRRIDDETFKEELGDIEPVSFFGGSGETVFVDPAACYHYGSRCLSGRLALFVTFNTDRPYVPAQPPIRGNGETALQAAREIRPDLDEAYLRRLLNA
jgi:hypothetical protein